MGRQQAVFSTTRHERPNAWLGKGKSDRSMETSKHHSAIQGLHDLLADSRKGYAEAARRLDDPQAAGLLRNISDKRQGMEDELATLLRRDDPDAKPGNGTIAGTMHRAWMEVRDALSATEHVDVLAECERGESFLLGRYDDVLGEAGLGENSRATLAGQRAEVEDNVSKVRLLRKTLEDRKN
jgi:uncharacterized protein (TIGR02284 family)